MMACLTSGQVMGVPSPRMGTSKLIRKEYTYTKGKIK